QQVVGARVVGVHLLETVDGGQRLFVFTVFPVDIGQVDQGLLGVHAERVAAFDGRQALARFVPGARRRFRLGVGIQLLGAPAGGFVIFCVSATATRGDQGNGQHDGRTQGPPTTSRAVRGGDRADDHGSDVLGVR